MTFSTTSYQSDGMGVSIGSHEDSETSERSEGTERTHTQSQSYSQTVHSTQSCSSATCTSTCTSTTTGTGTASASRTETNGGNSGSEETTSITPSLSHTTIAKGETPEGLVEEDEEEDEGEDESEVENAFLRASSPDEGLGRTAPSPVTPARSPSPEVIQVQPTRSSSSNSITLLYQARTRQRPDDFMTMELFL